MNSNMLVTASTLSDQDLLARLEAIAGNERQASSELVAHLAALDSRQMLYADQGYGSLFRYCTQALRLSEDAACNRIEAARACRRFPLILDLLASGSLSLTSVRLLAPHLTADNHQSVLAKARDRRRREIEALIAELAPRPDVPSSVRKVPSRTTTRQLWAGIAPAPGIGPGLAPGTAPVAPADPAPRPVASPAPGPVVDPASQPGAVPAPGPAMNSLPSAPGVAIAPAAGALPATPRPIVQASAPERYRVQFTIGQETHEKLRRLQALLRREIRDGDPGAIFDRALTVLLEKVEKAKLAVAAKPRSSGPIRPAGDPQSAYPSRGGYGSLQTGLAPPPRTAPPALPPYATCSALRPCAACPALPHRAAGGQARSLAA
jgi:hypothetical protein